MTTVNALVGKPEWRNGRRVALKMRYRKVCGFESHLGYGKPPGDRGFTCLSPTVLFERRGITHADSDDFRHTTGEVHNSCWFGAAFPGVDDGVDLMI